MQQTQARLIRVQPVALREVPSEASEARKFIVTSRDGRFYQTVYVEGDGEPDLGVVRVLGAAWLFQTIATQLHAEAAR